MFDEINKKLVVAPILIVPDWELLFEWMCNISDIIVREFVGVRKDNVIYYIYNAGKILDIAQTNYTMSEKEMLALVYSFGNSSFIF